MLEDARTMEQQGRLWEAGTAYEQVQDLPGEARVMCSLLEEALYAGHSGRAHLLICDIERLLGEDSAGEIGYWFARLAWSAGLDSLSRAGLEAVEGDPWLMHRAFGTALLYSGKPDQAVQEFRAAMESATTTRRRYYAALDMSYALLSSGMTDEAERVIVFLERAFPAEGLPRIQEALLCFSTGRGSRAAILLDSLSGAGTASVAVRDMASRLLSEME